MESQLPFRFSRCRNDGSNKTFAIIDLTKCRRNLRWTRTQEKGEARVHGRTEGADVSYLKYGSAWFNTGQVNISQNSMKKDAMKQRRTWGTRFLSERLRRVLGEVEDR